MIIIINYLCHHYCYWHVCWLWLGLLALRPSVLSFFTECDIFFYYKARQVITECDSFFITMYDKSYYKVRQLFSYKVRRMLLQSVAAFFITGCDFISLESCEKMLWQSATGISKCDSFLSKSCDNFITKCHRYCKMRQVL